MIVAFTSLSFVLVSSVNCTMVTIYYLCKSEPACSLNWAIVLCNNIWKNGVTLIFIQYIYYIYIYIHFRVIWVFGWFRVLHGTLHWPLLWLLVGELDRIPQWGDTCWANYWYIYNLTPNVFYPEPDCCTRIVLSSMGDGHSVLLTVNQWSSPQSSQTKDEWATDSCFALIGANQCLGSVWFGVKTCTSD